MKASEAAIIGCGFAGIAAARALERANVSYTIFESGSDLGGVWRDNTYPGVACDTPSHMYSFSFARWPWSQSHAAGPEILRYLRSVAEQFGILEHVKFDTKVESVTWDQQTEQYDLTTSDGQKHRFRYIISAVGQLNRPNVPSFEGAEKFHGEVLHTSEWRDNLSVSDKRIALIGTGSTGIQLLPELARSAALLLQFQREPGYILPKDTKVYSDAERRKKAQFLRYRLTRTRAYVRRHTSKGPSAFRPNTRQNIAAREQCITFLHSILGHRPDLVAALTPSYPFGGKRPVSADSNYFESFLRSNVQLVPQAVVGLDQEGVLCADRSKYPVDVVIYATGFRPTEFLASYDVYGEDGARLAEVWGDEPRAFLGISVPRFPNFFMLYGPNTNGMGLVFMLEQQAHLIEKALIRSRRLGRIGTVRVVPSWFIRYNSWLDRQLNRTVWVDANNYYKTPSGFIATQYPEGMPVYWLHTRLLRRMGLKVTRRA